MGKIKINKVDTHRIGELLWCNNITAEGFMVSYNASGYLIVEGLLTANYSLSRNTAS